MKVLIDPKAFFELSKKSNAIVLDASRPKPGQKDFERKEFIANSLIFNYAAEFAREGAVLPNTLPSSEQFEREAQKLGINKDSILLIYDAHGIFSAPRAWFMFYLMGARDIHVLNGGLPAWEAQGYPLVSEPIRAKHKGNFKANLNTDKLIEIQDIYAESKSGKSRTLDARGAGRFSGKNPEPRTGIRSGHIPKSINLPYTNLLENNQYKALENLKSYFKDIEQDKTINFTCGSGVTACILALAYYELGHENFKLYDGSWTEYGQSTFEVETE
ncbi:MAG: sulfurtransferase [Flavobacteriaceae bacterium]